MIQFVTINLVDDHVKNCRCFLQKFARHEVIRSMDADVLASDQEECRGSEGLKSLCVRERTKKGTARLAFEQRTDKRLRGEEDSDVRYGDEQLRTGPNQETNEDI